MVLLVLLGFYPQPILDTSIPRLAISSSGLLIPLLLQGLNRHDNNSTKPDRTATVADRGLTVVVVMLSIAWRRNHFLKLRSRLLGLTRRWFRSGLSASGRYGRYATDAR